MKRIIFILPLILFYFINCFGQKETWNWVFGDKAGLSWKPEKLRSFAAKGIDGTSDAILQNLPSSFSSSISSLEGVFSISDKDGNLLFYSDGIKIWNAEGTEIFGKLGGNHSSSQSGIILPYPGDDKKYICIGLGWHFDDNMGYVIVEANSPTNVVVKGKRTEFSGHTGPLGESMSAIIHANGEDWWIVAPGKGKPICFNAWLVTKAGVQSSNPVKTPTMIDYTDSNGSSGYLKFTPDGKHFVWGTWTEKKLIYGDFDNSTGQFSNIRYIDNHGAYGVEFSPYQKYLYTTLTSVSFSGGDLGVYIWDLEALLKGTTTTYLRKISNGFSKPHTLQLDVLGRIWVTDYNYTSTRNMFLIDNPDNLKDLKIYKLVNFLAIGSEVTIGLPSFSATFFKILGDKGFCVNFPKEFETFIPRVINGSEVAYSRWNWGNEEPEDIVQGSGDQKISHTYRRTGKYVITVTTYDNDDKQLGQPQTMDIEVYSCILPVNPNIHLYKNR